MITIRFANPEDAGLIADISRETFYDAFAVHNTAENMDKFMAEQFTRERLMQEVTDTDSIFLLAYVNNAIAGYARLRETANPPQLGNAPSIELARIYAVTSAIGKGVGNALMEECIRIAEERHKATIWLGVWEHNPRAIAFYTRWGFKKFGEHVFMLGDDVQTDWLMKKVL